jgi:ABC-type taurine transport system substrate-binding protein
MMAKKKPKKKSKSTTSNRKKITAKKTAGKKRAAKKPAKKKAVARKAVAKKPPQSVARPVSKRGSEAEKPFRAPRRSSEISGEESGDLQGLSRVEGADSESVDELLEEGNAFEAGIVSGVEEADDSGVREVHTREVPEDDVPEEYLDND